VRIDLAYTGPPLGAEQAAIQAREAGYGGLWTSESKHDPFLTLALAARSCPDWTIGSGIAVALARSPFTLAQSAWDLAQLSGGNFRLGLGSQVKAHITRRFSMPWRQPVEQMREAVGALRAIWRSFQTGEPLAYQGRHYAHTLLTPNFSPGPSPHHDIPVGLAAVGPRMTSLAGEIADFVLLHPFTGVETIAQSTLPALREGCRRAQRSLHQVEVVATLFAFLEDSQAERREQVVRQKVAFYGSTPAYRSTLVSLGRAELAPRLHALSREGAWQAMAELIDDSLLDAFRVRGRDQQELFRKVRERYRGLCQRAILTVPGE
jgi:probable F420-dependent oxidoreductase